jgi:2-oxoisovalerate dehydrogenase E1 component alpha subunit
MLESQMQAALKQALQFGSLLDGQLPPLASMFEDVYKDMPPHLKDQMRQAAALQGD